MQRVQLYCVVTAFLMCVTGSHKLIAQDAKRKPVLPKHLNLNIKTEGGTLIQGATIEAVYHNNCGGLAGNAKLSDEFGMAVFTCLDGPDSMLTNDARGKRFLQKSTGLEYIEVSCQHPDYIPASQRIDVLNESFLNGEEISIVLQRGFQIALDAVDNEGKRVESGLSIVNSGTNWYQRPWDLKRNGLLLSPKLNQSTASSFSFRVIRTATNESTLFSQTIPYDGRDQRWVLHRKTKLYPGVVLSGSISKNISRPIQGGQVMASLHNEEKLNWYATTEINPDGSFVFESLPPGDEVRLCAICDTAVMKNVEESKRETADLWIDTTVPGFEDELHFAFATDIRSDRFNGEPISLKLDNPSHKVVLEMVPASSVEIEVRDLEGNVIPNALVIPLARSNFGCEFPMIEIAQVPEQLDVTSMLGRMTDSSSWFAKQAHVMLNHPGEIEKAEFFSRDIRRFESFTPFLPKPANKDGKVTFAGMPSGPLRFGVFHMGKLENPMVGDVTINLELGKSKSGTLAVDISDWKDPLLSGIVRGDQGID